MAKKNGFKWFNVNFETPIEDIKEQYRKLVFVHHPDKGGKTEDMQQINAEYDKLKAAHYNIHRNVKGEVYTDEKQTTVDDVTNEFVDLLDLLIHELGINAEDFEVCGKFVWLHNTDKEHKEAYKKYGFRWSADKKSWYRAPSDYKKRKWSNKWSMDKIRSVYGSARPVHDEDKNLLTA